MSKARVWVIAVSVGIVGAAVFGRQLRALRDENTAAELVHEAEQLLTASLEDAPELSDLRAVDARRLCLEAQAVSPSARAEGLVELARALEALSRDDLPAARKRVDLARPALDAFPPLYVTRAEIARREGDLAKARAEIKQALRGGEADPRALLLATDLAREAGSGDEALQLAERGLLASPRSSALHERRGLAREMLRDLRGARADLERAGRLDQRAPSPLLHLGRMQYEAGEVRPALLSFITAAKRDERSADARLGSGACRKALGDVVGARVNFEEAAERAEERAEPLLALGDLDLAEGDLDGALVRYRRAVELDKQSAAAWVKLGNALVRVDAAEQAVLALRTAISLSPDLAQAHNGLGAALLALGQAPAAEVELGIAANLAPQDPNPWRMLSLLRSRSGDRAGAESAQAEADARSEGIELASLKADRTASPARRP